LAGSEIDESVGDTRDGGEDDVAPVRVGSVVQVREAEDHGGEADRGGLASEGLAGQVLNDAAKKRLLGEGDYPVDEDRSSHPPDGGILRDAGIGESREHGGGDRDGEEGRVRGDGEADALQADAPVEPEAFEGTLEEEEPDQGVEPE